MGLEVNKRPHIEIVSFSEWEAAVSSYHTIQDANLSHALCIKEANGTSSIPFLVLRIGRKCKQEVNITWSPEDGIRCSQGKAEDAMRDMAPLTGFFVRRGCPSMAYLTQAFILSMIKVFDITKNKKDRI